MDSNDHVQLLDTFQCLHCLFRKIASILHLNTLVGDLYSSIFYDTDEVDSVGHSPSCLSFRHEPLKIILMLHKR